MIGRVIGIARRFTADPMLRNSAFIMLTTVVTSLLGYVFWLAVARTFTAEVTGRGSATTSALQGAALFASVGTAAAMIEWLPRCTSALEWRQRVTAAAVAAIGGGTAGALVVLVVLGHALDVLPELRRGGEAALFVAGTVLFAVGVLIDYVAVAQHRGGVMLLRNLVMSGLRIPLLFAPAIVPGTTDTVLSAWVVSSGASVVVGVAAFASDRAGRTFRPAWGSVTVQLRQMATSLVGQHAITIAAMMTTYVLPVLVVARVSPSANAYFYATWMLGSVFFMVSPAVSTALFAEGAADPARVLALARRAGLMIGAMLAVPVLGYLVLGGRLLGLFGPDYPAAGTLLLTVLTLSALPDAVTNVGVAVLRATGRLRAAFGLNASMLAGALVGSWLLLPELGIVAVGLSWLVAQSIGAGWVLGSPRILRGSARADAVPEPAGSRP